MWIAAMLIAWILGSVSLYCYLVATAKEPVHGECVECRRSECTDCPYLASEQQARRAA